jgi:hypothetical protein
LVVHATNSSDDDVEWSHLGHYLRARGFEVTRATRTPAACGPVDRELAYSDVITATRSWGAGGSRGLLLWPPETHTDNLTGLEEELGIPVINVGAAGVWLGLHRSRYMMDLGCRLSRLKTVFDKVPAPFEF